jgi:thioredoxin-like negative regulator of GroEL
MKKQIGLITLSTILIAFMAFSSVASAQASNVQVLFFESPMCSVCQQVRPLVESAAAQTGAKLIVYDVSQSPGSGIAKANGISGTPTIVIQGGQTLVGAVTEQQIVAAIQAAAGSATPTPKAVATPTPVPVVKATATPKVVKATTTKVVKATATPKVVNAMTTTKAQPSIEVVTATKTPTASTQTVPEFSLLGLGAPALVVGAIYLFLRKR